MKSSVRCIFFLKKCDNKYSVVNEKTLPLHIAISLMMHLIYFTLHIVGQFIAIYPHHPELYPHHIFIMSFASSVQITASAAAKSPALGPFPNIILPFITSIYLRHPLLYVIVYLYYLLVICITEYGLLTGT